MCVGATFGAMSTMRTKLLPDALQASIMNIYRLLLNILVVTGGRLGDLVEPKYVFATISLWFFLAAVLQIILQRLVSASERYIARQRPITADPLAKSPLPSGPGKARTPRGKSPASRGASRGASPASHGASPAPRRRAGGATPSKTSRSPVRTRKSTGAR
jgi:hypothetical protein